MKKTLRLAFVSCTHFLLLLVSSKQFMNLSTKSWRLTSEIWSTAKITAATGKDVVVFSFSSIKQRQRFEEAIMRDVESTERQWSLKTRRQYEWTRVLKPCHTDWPKLSSSVRYLLININNLLAKGYEQVNAVISE